MGAALHLATVRQFPPPPKRKRKGGGGGDGYDKLVTRVYKDPRMTPEARELILLLAWLQARDPDRYDADGNLISWRKRASNVLGDKPNPRRQSRLADLLYADRPRYEDDYTAEAWQHRVCAAPMIRRPGLCGQHAIGNDYKIDQETGWRTPLWYCRRHETWGRQLAAHRHAEPGPEPIPNTGGLVTSYLLTKGQEQAWAKLYKEAAEWKRDLRWEPPQRYGLRADDWPLPGRKPEPEPFRLRLAAVDGELLNGGT